MNSSPHTSRVVCFGLDLELLRTRVQVLARVYDTVEVRSVDMLRNLPAEFAFDLVLLCHTLSMEECRASMEIAQRLWPQTKIMALASGLATASFEKADAVVVSSQGPAALLRAIDQLIHREHSPAAASF